MVEAIQLSKDMEKEIAKEDAKIDAATKDKNEAVKNQEAAIVEIDKDQLELEGLEQQLEVLKDMRENALDKLLEKHPFFKGINKLRKGLKGVIPALRGFLKMFMMGFVYVSVAILGILALVKLFGPIIKDTIGTVIKVLTPIMQFTMAAVGLIFDGVQQVFGAFFGDGTFSDAIDGLLKIGLGILGTLLGLALGALAALGTLLIAGIGHAIKRIGLFFKEMFSSWKGFLKNFGVLLAIGGTIVALIMGAPVWLAVVIGLAIFRVGKMLLDPILDFIGGIAKAVSDIWPFAEGGQVKNNGLQLVGEKGPELVSLPKGSQVFSNRDSVKMVNNARTTGGSGTTNNINITINAKDTSDAEMRRIAEKVGRLVNNSINRNTGMSGIR